MAKIIINIPDDEYNYFKSDECFDADDGFDAIEYICNGTPLPKGHGRLIDVDEIPIDCDYYDVENAPTVEAIPKAEYEARLKADMVAILDKIRAEILEEKECAYADFERYKVEYLGQDAEDVFDSLPQDEFRYGMERVIEIIDKYRANNRK